MSYFKRGQLIERQQTIATSSGSTTITLSSPKIIRLTGTQSHTVQMPAANTLDVNQGWIVRNQSTGLITVTDNSGNILSKVSAKLEYGFYVSDNSTAAGVWDVAIGGASEDIPLRVHAGTTPDSKVYFETNTKTAMDTTGLRTPPVKGFIPDVVASTLDLSSGATTGATFLGATIPTGTVGQFVRAGFTLLSNGYIQTLWSSFGASLSALANPGTLFVKSGLPIGYIDLEQSSVGNGSFNASVTAGGQVKSVFYQADGKILLGGLFTSFLSTFGRNRVVRLTSTGAVDTSFCSNATDGNKFNTDIAAVYATSSSVFVGGDHTSYGGTSGRDYFTVLNSDGTLNTTFMSSAVDGAKFNAGVYAITSDSSGNIYVGGAFTSYNGTSGRNRFLKFSSAGVLDTAFCANATDSNKFAGVVNSIDIQSDGKILVGGGFLAYGGTSGRTNLVRLNSDGTIDTAFCANATDSNKFISGAVNSIKVQADGKILVGGSFSTYGGTSGRAYLIRLNSDGTLDTSFCSNAVDSGKFSNSINSVTQDPSGLKIFVGGIFTSYAGSTGRDYFIVLNSDGTLNATITDSFSYPSKFTGSVLSTSILSGKILIGGGFGYSTSAAIIEMTTSGVATTNISYLLKTAGSSTNIVENMVSGVPRIWRFLGGSGAGSSGSGSGTGDDLISSSYRASFSDSFDENSSDSASAVDATSGKTNATYDTVNGMYTMSYDASKTIAAGSTTTSILLSSAPAFTVAIGDIVVIGSVARKVTAVTSQTNLTTDAFTAAPSTGAQVTVSQAVHTKDVYNLAVDGVSLASAFGSATFSDVLVDYEETSTASDAIFDINTAAAAGFVASHDGTTYTTVQKRPTDPTTQISNTLLSAAGTALYLRFFSVKTSGSGVVNLLRYKAYMQKSYGTSQTSVINTAYCYSDGTNTPINCAVGVLGGKTTITLNWSYPVSVNSGTTKGALDVLVNGVTLPRYVAGSVKSTDGYYTEVSANVIQLDKNYSSLNYDIEITQKIAYVDTSTTNTTSISQVQEFLADGFQSFVNPTESTLTPTTTGTGGVPAAGYFYSSVLRRKAIPDLSQNLKVQFGVERFVTQNLVPVPDEIGPNGEPVFGITNDLNNQIRLVGSGWTYAHQSSSTANLYTTVANDYVEFVFQGTGLNLLTMLDTARDARVTIDGGTEGVSNILGTTMLSGGGRGYNQYHSVNLASNLTFGIHTVKVRMNTTGLVLCGFEVLTESSTGLVRVNPGVSYSGGKRVVTTSLNTFNYASVVTGTSGGRVLVYQNSDGTIGKSFTPVDSLIRTGSSTDHSNEEISRIYYPTEFGVGRTDDFSRLTSGSNTSAAFTLDDNSTTLQGGNSSVGFGGPSGNNSLEVLYNTTAGTIIYRFSFVGCGIDLKLASASAATQSFTSIMIDNQYSVGAINLAGNFNTFIQKIASGLPYGSHCLTLTCAAPNPGIGAFIVYQPKLPTLPAGAFYQADYNVLPAYSFRAFATDSVSVGIIRKQNYREMQFYGTGWAYTMNQAEANGTNFYTTTTNDYVEYSFFGVGFEHRFTTNGVSATMVMLVDGSSSLAGFSSLTSGTGITSFTASTGSIVTSTTATNGNFVAVYGLSLGWHKIRITKTAGTGGYFPQSFDIMTPIYSSGYVGDVSINNTSAIGNMMISDGRKITPLKDASAGKKRVSIAYGSGTTSTTSTTLVGLPDMQIVHKSRTGRVKITFDGNIYVGSNGWNTLLKMLLNGLVIDVRSVNTTANYYSTQAMTIIQDVAPEYPIKVGIGWMVETNGATMYAGLNQRTLIVEDI